MMCDRCHQPVTREESKPYNVPGASGPGITIYVHKRPCAVPVSAQPQTYPQRRP